jgi:hypothetical protein
VTLVLMGAYTCWPCEVTGRGPEDEDGRVWCWCCGEPALITARIFADPRQAAQSVVTKHIG